MASRDDGTRVVEGVRGFSRRKPRWISSKRPRTADALAATCRVLPAGAGVRGVDPQGIAPLRGLKGARLRGTLATVQDTKHPHRAADGPATNRAAVLCVLGARVSRSEREGRSDARWRRTVRTRVLLGPRAQQNARPGRRVRFRSAAPPVAMLPMRIGKKNSAPSRTRHRPRGSTPGQVTTATAACSRAMRVAGGSDRQSTA